MQQSVDTNVRIQFTSELRGPEIRSAMGGWVEERCTTTCTLHCTPAAAGGYSYRYNPCLLFLIIAIECYTLTFVHIYSIFHKNHLNRCIETLNPRFLENLIYMI